jgi:hypothetical protein
VEHERSGLVALTLFSEPVSYALGWQAGDVLATQGDAYIHVDPLGTIKQCVPPCAEGLS